MDVYKDLPSFDTLLDMAQHHPEQLQQLRQQLTQDTIEQAPKHRQSRLRGLQFQIDLHCKLAKTHLSACIQLSNMMHQSFLQLSSELNRPAITAIEPTELTPTNDNILPFTPR